MPAIAGALRVEARMTITKTRVRTPSSIRPEPLEACRLMVDGHRSLVGD